VALIVCGWGSGKVRHLQFVSGKMGQLWFVYWSDKVYCLCGGQVRCGTYSSHKHPQWNNGRKQAIL